MKRRGLIVVAAAALTVLAACGGGSDSGSGANESIKVGGWLPLTGPLAGNGIPMKAGTDSFFKQLNADGGINGRKVDWQGIDNAFDPQQTIQVARELVNRDKVVAIVGANGSTQTEATFPFVLDQSKVPIVGPYAGLGTWFDPVKERLFGTFPLNDDSARAAAKWAADDGAKKVTIVRDDPDAFKIPGDAAQKELEKSGATVKTVVVKLGTTDYAPIVSQVKKTSPDAVITLLPTTEVASYLNAAKLEGIGAPAYGYAVAVSNSLLDLAKENAEGFHGMSVSLPPTADDPAVEEYRRALAKYAPKQKPDFYSLATYGYAKVFAEIVKTIDGPITADSITAAYAKANNVVTGVLPPMDFTGNHVGTDKLVRVQVVDGKWAQKSDFVSGAAE